MFLRGLCLLLLAVPVFAAGITSFEPDTTTRPARERDREAMVETPIWYGITYSVGSRYERGWSGLVGAPNQLGGIATTVSWPWRSRLQGWSEFAYVIRTLYDEGYVQPWGGGPPYFEFVEDKLDMFTVRGGVEYRFGAKGRPWCTVGAGLGGGFKFGEEFLPAAEVLGRATCFFYPSGHTRLGFMFSGGPAWVARPAYLVFGPVGWNDRESTRTHYELGLRIESRLRFPVANAD